MPKGFDVFVLCSLTEGLGTSILDAMAASKPVVGTRAGGIPEVIDDGVTGFVVPPRDDKAQAEAIQAQQRDQKLRERMGEAGRKRVAERFSVERMVAGTAAVYARLASRPHAADRSDPAGGG
jgi:glycosyltransferase involved in cell wall biosynthesis